MPPAGTLDGAAADLAAGRTTAAALVEAALERATDPAGEGERTFVALDAEGARAAARAADVLRAAGAEPSPYAGIPVSVKDLFDVRGQVTRSGSVVLDEGPAAADAAAVAGWRRAGLVLLGRTNMTEFAYSGLGINPHHGTPANPWDRGSHRIPGGSSSGAAVSVSDGMAFGGLGSDTGGSCRIPAALCGLVGFKPTQDLISRAGMAPLSTSLDAAGVIAPTVACCAELVGLARGEVWAAPRPVDLPPRLAVPRTLFFDDAEPEVVAAFERALGKLADAGAELVEIELAELAEIAGASAKGGFPAAESYAWHRELIESDGERYDPRVLVRIRRGEGQSAADLIDLIAWRRSFIARVAERLAPFDGFVFPTVPALAPPLADFEDEDTYGRLNLLMLRNPTVVNLLDGCAISVPMQEDGEAPSGLTIAALGGQDDELLRVAAWAEERL
jgi:aspartyl-tRNA(Asn)/glutamyl-tRNA(Gln) amidotransferase subunit A